jgi:hypothetical protein
VHIEEFVLDCKSTWQVGMVEIFPYILETNHAFDDEIR